MHAYACAIVRVCMSSVTIRHWVEIQQSKPQCQIFQAAGIPLVMKCSVQLHRLQSGSILSRRHAHEATGAHQTFATSHRTHVPCRCLSCQHVIHIPTRSFTKGQKVVLICMGLGILGSLLSPGVAASEWSWKVGQPLTPQSWRTAIADKKYSSAESGCPTSLGWGLMKWHWQIGFKFSALKAIHNIDREANPVAGTSPPTCGYVRFMVDVTLVQSTWHHRAPVFPRATYITYRYI